MIALYDSHCHLDYDALRERLPEVLARAAERGVQTVLVPGVDPEQWARAEELRSLQYKLRFAVGLHPQIVGDLDDAAIARALDAMPQWIDRLGACAIGELGWDKPAGNLARQSAIADAQIEIAKARALPIILHVVEAHGLAIERLTRHAPLRGVVHSYSGSAELVLRYAALGLSISIGPSIARAGARRIREAALAIASEHLLAETDGPDQYLPARADRTGEPADLERVVLEIARARGEDLDRVARLTTDNAARLFG